MPQVPTLHLAHVMSGCQTLGPGRRTVFWVRGCARRCSGCIAEPILGPGPALSLTVEEALARVLAEDDDGVTFSGGEPMEQAPALAALAREVQAAGRSVMVYSGFTLDELRDSPPPGATELLAHTDILVDGAYDATRRADLLWRGSANQHIYLLSPRFEALAERLEREGVGVELRVALDGRLFWAGVPGPGFQAALTRATAALGAAEVSLDEVWA